MNLTAPTEKTAAKVTMPTLKAGISGKAGFTLIEITMVLLIFSVLMMAAAPRLAAYLSSSKLETSVSRLAVYMEHVRDEAIYKRKVLVVRCRIEEGTFSVYYPWGEEERGVLMKPLDLPREIKVVDIHLPGREKKSMGEAVITFYPGGLADSAFIHFKDNEDREITVELAPLSRKVEIHEGYLEAV